MERTTIRTILEEINNHLAENLARPAQNRGWEKKYPQGTEFLKVYDVSDIRHMISEKFKELSNMAYKTGVNFDSYGATITLPHSSFTLTVKRKKTPSLSWNYKNQLSASQVVVSEDKFMDMTPQEILDEVIVEIDAKIQRQNNTLKQFTDELTKLNIPPKDFLRLKTAYEHIDFNLRWNFEREHKNN